MTAAAPTLTDAAVRPAVTGLAIFDLDRTVIAGASVADFGRGVVAAGIVGRGVLARHLVAELRFKHRGLGTETLERITDRLLRSAAGLPYAALESVGRTVAVTTAARAYPGVLDIVRRHRDAGDTTVLLSASPEPLVAAIADHLGFDVALGTRIEVLDGRVSGRIVGGLCHGRGKLRRLGDEFGPIDLQTCAAYADSGSDLPLLCAVGVPTAVNADRALASAARAAGWPTLRFDSPH
jgi:HAD superfamily hydrolase (TIGR01490 family)